MEKTGKIILVTGATGRQGGTTARHLMAAGWQVRAFTRSRNSPAAQVLHLAGAEIAEGDNNDRASLEGAMQSVYGVFSLQFASYADEVRQGKNVAEVAQEARVQHFVYASTSGAERQSCLRPFSKWEIEQSIQELDLPTTILRPSVTSSSSCHEGTAFFYNVSHQSGLSNSDVACKHMSVWVVPTVLTSEGDGLLLEETLQT